MDENRQMKITLNTAIAIMCIIVIIIIGLFVIFRHYILTQNEDSNTNEISQKDNNEIYIFSEEIKSIVIKYYQGYNYASGKAISDTIPLNQIKLELNDLKELSKIINSLKKLEISKNDEMYEHIQYDYIFDKFKLEINDDFSIYIGNEYGIVDGKDNYFQVPEVLYNKVIEIVENYNKKNLYKTINSEKITIICGKEKLEITDEEQLSEVSNYSYYVIKGTDEEFKSEEVAYILDLKDGRKINIYHASVISCIYNINGTHEYIYTGNLVNLVEKIFNNSKVKIVSSNVNSIVVTYKDKKSVIDNKDKITQLLKEFKNLQYNDFNYLKSMTEEDFDENNIKIHVKNSKYIIPEDRSIGNRYYIDEDGKIYDVSGLYNNNLETYFKELVK